MRSLSRALVVTLPACFLLALGCRTSLVHEDRAPSEPRADIGSLAPSMPAPSSPAPLGHDAGVPNVHASREVEAQILSIAREYQKWGRVDERPNIAPGLCRMPTQWDYGQSSTVQLSSAGEGSPHGRKLYFLYAKDKFDYLRLGAPPAVPDGHVDVSPPVDGQVIVKQSWTAKPAHTDPACALTDAGLPIDPAKCPAWTAALQASMGRAPEPIRTATAPDGSVLETGDLAGLYIMMKDAKAKGTDAGWTYATVTPDLATVTASGPIASCISCHEKARYERLFGPKPAQRPVPLKGHGLLAGPDGSLLPVRAK